MTNNISCTPAAATAPTYTHDCDHCIWLGTFLVGQAGQNWEVETGNQGDWSITDDRVREDWYVCVWKSAQEQASLIRRTGSDGWEYASFPSYIVAEITEQTSIESAVWHKLYDLAHTHGALSTPRV